MSSPPFGTDCNIHAQDRPERQAHEAGQGKDRRDAGRRVLQLVGQEQQAEVANQRHDRAEVRHVHRHGQSGHRRTEQQGG